MHGLCALGAASAAGPVDYQVRLFTGQGCSGTKIGTYTGTSGTSGCSVPPAGTSPCGSILTTYLGNNEFNILCCSNIACDADCSSLIIDRYGCYDPGQVWLNVTVFQYDLGSSCNSTTTDAVGELAALPEPATVSSKSVVGSELVKAPPTKLPHPVKGLLNVDAVSAGQPGQWQVRVSKREGESDRKASYVLAPAPIQRLHTP